MPTERKSKANPKFNHLMASRGFKDVADLTKRSKVSATSLYRISSADNAHKPLKAYLELAKDLNVPLDLLAKIMLNDLQPQDEEILGRIIEGQHWRLDTYSKTG